MNKRLIIACMVIVLLIVFTIGVLQRDRIQESENEFKVMSPAMLLEKAISELPFLTRNLYGLDYFEILYKTSGDDAIIKEAEVGFSYYIGFDLYAATRIRYEENRVVIKGMLEETKTIYDDLYDSKAYVGNGAKELSSFMMNSKSMITDFLDEVLQENKEYENANIDVKINNQDQTVICVAGF